MEVRRSYRRISCPRKLSSNRINENLLIFSRRKRNGGRLHNAQLRCFRRLDGNNCPDGRLRRRHVDSGRDDVDGVPIGHLSTDSDWSTGFCIQRRVVPPSRSVRRLTQFPDFNEQFDFVSVSDQKMKSKRIGNSGCHWKPRIHSVARGERVRQPSRIAHIVTRNRCVLKLINVRPNCRNASG